MYRNKFRHRHQHLLTLFVGLALTVLPAASTVHAQSKDKQKPLEEKNNPELIGKRNINKGQMNFYSLEREAALGRQLAYEIDSQSRIITDPLVNEFVNRITQNIVLHSDAKIPFTVKVLDDEAVNAFALPGGFLYVNRGLLEAAENEAEVAGVMAHEIAHVTARHGMEQQTKAELFNYASIPLIFLGGVGGYAIQQAVGIGVPLGFLKFSRGAEKEADRLGAQYMWAAGYDPNALVSFFEKLNAREKNKPGFLSKIFSTHPMTGDRITEAQKLIARFPEKNEYALSSSEYQQIKARVGALTTSRRVDPADDKRPVLRRRPDNGDPTRTDDDDDRPVLRRRDDNSSTTTTDTPVSTSTKDEERVELKRSKPAPTNSDSDRPTLKRREGSDSDVAKPAESTGESSDKPVLKRRPDSESKPASDSKSEAKPESETKPEKP